MPQTASGDSGTALLRFIGAAMLLLAAGMATAATLAPGDLTRLLPAFSSMGLNTQLAFGLCGAALMASAAPRLMAALGLLLALLALSVLLQHLLNLFPEDGYWRYVLNTASGAWPGRMSPGAAVAFLLAGCVFLMLSRVRGSTGIVATHLLLGGMFLMAFISLMGHVTGAVWLASDFSGSVPERANPARV